MLDRFREHFGAAGLVVAVVALIAALGGGAYAASSGSAGPNATASGKGKPGPRGKTGKTGARGPTGPTGPQGSVGAKGEQGGVGANGRDGTNGANGANGTSVTSEEFVGTKEGKCVGRGGSKFVSASGASFACNGKEGSPWTAGGFLPSTKTETGTWALGQGGTSAGTQVVPISFPLPLETAPQLTVVWLSYGPFAEAFEASEITEILEEGAEHGCPGFDEGIPLADPGHLCVYANYLLELKPKGTGHPNTIRSIGEPPQIYTGGSSIPDADEGGKAPGVNQVGTTLELTCEQANCEGLGVWAVTAE